MWLDEFKRLTCPRVLLQPPSQEHVLVDRKAVAIRERQGISIAGKDSHAGGLYGLASFWTVLPAAAHPALFLCKPQHGAADEDFIFAAFLGETSLLTGSR
jgi:hypothetical protein